MSEPTPLFAAQPTKVFRRGLFSKRPARSRLKFFSIPFSREMQQSLILCAYIICSYFCDKIDKMLV
ncbi:hypothetical protein B5F55_12185 [Anaerotruncus colihominis]|nr:hypothetical protein B5F55_12185 [Anaerotruncus colihominis]